MPVSEKTYQLVALEDPSGGWELYCGELRRKPGMTMKHNDIQMHLGGILAALLDRRQYRLRIDNSRTSLAGGSYFVPDLFVVPTPLALAKRGQPDTLETYADPLPLVVEVWSRSTGEYDVDSKLPAYRARGDLEIWRCIRTKRRSRPGAASLTATTRKRCTRRATSSPQAFPESGSPSQSCSMTEASTSGAYPV